MAIPANQLRNGAIVLLDGKPNRVVSKQHVTPGKGQAIIQTVLCNLETGTNFNHRVRSAESVETARLETHELQYMYRSGDNYTFMNQESYEMIELSADVLGDNGKYLTENMVINAEYWQTTVVGVTVPMTVVFRITETEPPMKGATASGGPKPATLENGMVVRVPRHLNVGELIKIDTRDDSFVERVTE